MTEDEILYGKRQSPEVMRTVDAISLMVNRTIRARGISKGFVCVQEDFNKTLLQLEKLIYWASIETDKQKRGGYLDEALKEMRNVSVDIRYMLKNNALTVGIVGELSRYVRSVNGALYRWRSANNSV